MRIIGPSLFVVSLIVGIGVLGFGIFQSIQFERGCSGHLKRAADANTIELAQQELRKAVEYIEANGLTEGDTSVLYSMPESELDFWYANLKASLNELETTPSDIDRLTASNQLIKLRETINDSKSKGSRVTVPPNVHVFPNQVACRLLGLASLAGMFVGGTVWISQYESSKKACGG